MARWPAPDESVSRKLHQPVKQRVTPGTSALLCSPPMGEDQVKGTFTTSNPSSSPATVSLSRGQAGRGLAGE